MLKMIESPSRTFSTIAQYKEFFEKMLGKNVVIIKTIRPGFLKFIVSEKVSKEFLEIAYDQEFTQLIPVTLQWCYGIRDYKFNKYRFIANENFKKI